MITIRLFLSQSMIQSGFYNFSQNSNVTQLNMSTSNISSPYTAKQLITVSQTVDQC
jgi:hypothetical protein